MSGSGVCNEGKVQKDSLDVGTEEERRKAGSTSGDRTRGGKRKVDSAKKADVVQEGEEGKKRTSKNRLREKRDIIPAPTGGTRALRG